jgi:hypothetical protein
MARALWAAGPAEPGARQQNQGCGSRTRGAWEVRQRNQGWGSGMAKTDERLVSRTRSGRRSEIDIFYLSEVAAITGVPGGVGGCADANRNNTPP